MRWELYFYKEKKDGKNKAQTIAATYGLKSLNLPPQVKELIHFKTELLDMIKSFKFRKTRSHF